MDFSIRNIAGFEIFGLPVIITETHVSMWIIMAILIVLAIVVRCKLKTFKAVPGGFQNVIETLVGTIDRFVRNSAGEKLAYLGHWFFAVILFILLSNMSGLFFLRPPTADWSVTAALAVATFMLIQIMGVRHQKGEFIKNYFRPIFLFFPLNLLGELAKPIALSFRLFGNVLAGVLLLSFLYEMAPVVLQLGLPAFLHGYFDVASGLLQTYVFTVLSLCFIGGMAGTVE